jgi:ribosomal protein L32
MPNRPKARKSTCEGGGHENAHRQQAPLHQPKLKGHVNMNKGQHKGRKGSAAWRHTTCEYCGERITLTTVDADGVLIGDDCSRCGEYVTRYMPGQKPQ